MSPSSSATDLDLAVREVLAAVFGLEPAAVTPSLARDDVAAWDSLGHVNLVLALEQRFGVEFEVTQIAALRSCADVRAALAALGEAS